MACYDYIGGLAMDDYSSDINVQVVHEGELPSQSSTCPVCDVEFSSKDCVRCAQCGKPHHAACWLYNNGCAVASCNGKQGNYLDLEPKNEQETIEVTSAEGVRHSVRSGKAPGPVEIRTAAAGGPETSDEMRLLQAFLPIVFFFIAFMALGGFIVFRYFGANEVAIDTPPAKVSEAPIVVPTKKVSKTQPPISGGPTSSKNIADVDINNEAKSYLKQLKRPAIELESLYDARDIGRLVEDGLGRIWAGTTDALVCLTEEPSIVITRAELPFMVLNFRNIVSDPLGRIAFIAGDGGEYLAVRDNSNGEFKLVPFASPAQPQHTDIHLVALPHAIVAISENLRESVTWLPLVDGEYKPPRVMPTVKSYNHVHTAMAIGDEVVIKTEDLLYRVSDEEAQQFYQLEASSKSFTDGRLELLSTASGYRMGLVLSPQLKEKDFQGWRPKADLVPKELKYRDYFIAIDKDRESWLISCERKRNEITLSLGEAGKQLKIELPATLRDSGDLRINCCLYSRNNVLWIGTNRGLVRKDGELLEYIGSAATTYERPVLDPSWSSMALVNDKHHHLWLVSKKNVGLIGPNKWIGAPIEGVSHVAGFFANNARNSLRIPFWDVVKFYTASNLFKDQKPRIEIHGDWKSICDKVPAGHDASHKSFADGPDGFVYGAFDGTLCKFIDGHFLPVPCDSRIGTSYLRLFQFDDRGWLWTTAARNKVLAFRVSKSGMEVQLSLPFSASTMAQDKNGVYYFGDYGKTLRLEVTADNDNYLESAKASVIFKEGADHLHCAPDGTVWGIDVRYMSNAPNEIHLVHLVDEGLEDYLLKKPLLRGTPKFGIDLQGRILLADHGLWRFDPR